jgi:hypothetical protein
MRTYRRRRYRVRLSAQPWQEAGANEEQEQNGFHILMMTNYDAISQRPELVQEPEVVLRVQPEVGHAGRQRLLPTYLQMARL